MICSSECCWYRIGNFHTCVAALSRIQIKKITDLQRYLKQLRSILTCEFFQYFCVCFFQMEYAKQNLANHLAYTFNFYFSNIAKKLDSEIPNLGSSNDFDGLLDDDINPNSLILYPVPKYECENLIPHLNDTYYGLDSLSAKIPKRWPIGNAADRVAGRTGFESRVEVMLAKNHSS